MRNITIMALILVPLICLDARSESAFRDKVSASQAFFDIDIANPRTEIPKNNSAASRHVSRDAKFVGSERASTKRLLLGYSPGLKMLGRPYWKSDQIFRVTLFEGDPVFLENLRIYDIKPGVIGWIGAVKDFEGNQIGSASFEIYEQKRMRGRLDLPGKLRLEIEPTTTADNYDVLEFTPKKVNARFDSADTRTPEQRDVDKEVWRSELSKPDIEKLRKDRDKQFEALKEKEQNKLF